MAEKQLATSPSVESNLQLSLKVGTLRENQEKKNYLYPLVVILFLLFQ